MFGIGGVITSIMTNPRRPRFVVLPGFKATSCLTVVLLICLETVLLSTVSNCAKTFYMHWNTTNSIFRIDNTDHIIDVNKGNLAFEYDQVHIICPVYEPGTFDNETEKYIIYNVSKVEYETCRITNANPRIIAICDKPQKLMFFTITFRPFTPQPGGLEFLPGNDYYFISTSSKDDLHRRIGGRCSTNNMKVVFKVCCAPEEQNTTTSSNHGSSGVSINTNIDTNNRVPSSSSSSSSSSSASATVHSSSNGGHLVPPVINTNISNVVQSTMSWPGWSHPQRTPITTTLSVQKFYPHVTSPRPNINTHNNSSYSPSHKPTKKTNEYDKHPNEVVKNEELTFSNNSRTLRPPNCASLIILVTLVIFNKFLYFNMCPSWCQR
ncbi:ephrin-B2 isoform X1 [Bradysia coprophila]|uniref:ephrin-B2 isoform X1 n=2 Tax=Bradysia coprophila TaxID=38358 RepID=UPI00187DB222|nr:ephrin-B2 isoform X1 [Bradysia coprophila]